MSDIPKLFDFVDAVSSSKEDLIGNSDDVQAAEKAYDPFMVARAMSYFPDTVLYANELNIYRDMPKVWHFEYLRGSLKPRKRFSRWFKKEKDEKISFVANTFGTSREKAAIAASLMLDSDIEWLKAQMEGK